jgi:hypothetical protein
MSSNIEVKLDVLNQKASPALYAAALVNRPTAGFVGRLFVDSDSPSTGLYRDTGTTWVQIADQGVGTTGTLQLVTVNGNTTNIGISVTTNGIGIGVAAPAANILDIHGTTGVLAQLENTTTQNSLLSFRNQGAGVWSIGNGYNAGANDFIIYDAVSFVNRLTIKATGQTFIGADTTSSGLFVVNNATSDSHIVVIGANAPSLRFRNAGSGGTISTGLGVSTAVNNFIQGSVSGDYCIFNSSTTASPILFGVYNSGASQTQEVARISAAQNFLIGKIVDAGYKFDVTGSSRFVGTIFQNSGNTTTLGNGLVFDSTYRIFASSGVITYQSNSTGYQHQFTNASTKPFSIVNIDAGATAYTITGSSANMFLLTGRMANTSVSTSSLSAIYVVPTDIGGASYTGITWGLNIEFPVPTGTGLTLRAIQTNRGDVLFNTVSGSVGIGATTTINSSSILQITSTTQGFLPPRMTTAQKTAIATPATGLVVYDSTLNKLALYTGAGWETVTSI